MFSYTRSDLKARVNSLIYGKKGVILDFDQVMNSAVRQVISDADLRTTKRTIELSAGLFSDIYQYAAPSDLKGRKVIDLLPQTTRVENSEFNLVPAEEFSRRRERLSWAVDDRDAIKKILIASDVTDYTLVGSSLDALDSGGGGWEVYGNAENLRTTNVNYVKGSGALLWDLSDIAGETAGIVNESLTVFDWSAYLADQVFVWQGIPNVTGINSFELRIGTDELNYYVVTATSAHDDTQFRAGVNLIRFDLANAEAVGNPNAEDTDYIAFFMNKESTKISQTGFMTDHIIFKRGSRYSLAYYSKYGWQSEAGVYKENSTADSDYLTADTDEFELFLYKAVEIAAWEARENDASVAASNKYKEKLDLYISENPSEVKPMTSTYYDFIDQPTGRYEDYVD